MIKKENQVIMYSECFSEHLATFSNKAYRIVIYVSICVATMKKTKKANFP